MDANPYQPPVEEVPPVLPPEVASGDTGTLASRSSRLGASMIDGIIGLALVLPLQYALGLFDPAGAQLQNQILGGVLGTIGWCAVQIWFFRDGQSIGKRLSHIRIVENDTGHTASAGRILGLRLLPFHLIAYLPWVGYAIILLDPLLIFGSQRRCLHDLIAGTKVVDV